MKTSRKVIIAAVGLIVVVAAVSFTVFGRDDDEYEFFTAEVTRGRIQNTVNATGTLEAVVTVQVGSQISGQIQTLYADFNSVVRAGQLLAKIDPRNFEAQLENARASLVSARARVRTAEADLANSRASLTSARASLEAARVEAEKADTAYRRSEELSSAGLVSETDLENAKAAADAARARVEQAAASIEQAEAQIVSREAGLDQAHATVVQAEAEVNRARINLEYTDITSPVDGVVISREVDAGQTVAAGMSAPTLFNIANDLAQMRVKASVDEADIGKLAANNEVEFTVDAFPNQQFRGRIEEIRLNPQTVQNVVTYDVIVGVANPDLQLKPGMTANITVTVDGREGVLSVSNAALRYSPPNVDAAALADAREQVARPGDGPPEDAASAAPSASGEVRAGRAAGDPPPAPAPAGETAGRGLIRGGGGESRERAFRRGGSGTDLPDGFPGFSGQTGRTLRPRDEPETVDASAPGQLWDVGEKIQFRQPPVQPPRPGRVWVLNAERRPEMRAVMLGITDGSRTELVAGDLQEGEMIIIGDSSQGETPARPEPQFGRGGFPGGGFPGVRVFR